MTIEGDSPVVYFFLAFEFTLSSVYWKLGMNMGVTYLQI